MYQQRASAEKALSDRLAALRDAPAETEDGVRLPLYANIALVSDGLAARSSGAEGVGLYRTEYLFLLREVFPVEEEQYAIYRDLLESFAPKPVTLRTLGRRQDSALFPHARRQPLPGSSWNPILT
jgi:phosphotransferase system enzyme I (PtsP)